MAFSPGDAAMPVYLLIASIFNGIFFYRSIIDVRSKATALSGAPSIALLLTAISEFVWVLPCFIQCFLVFVLGHDGDWAPEREASGCDIQGFYSQLGSVSGMLSTLVLAVLTLRIARSQRMPSTSQMLIIGGALFALSLLVSVLPFMGAGNYSYSGEGFCYIDWYDSTSSAIMLTVVIPTFLAVISIDGALYYWSDAWSAPDEALGLLDVAALANGWWPRLLIVCMALAFVSAWCLWIPAAFIGLSGGTFPDGYMITGAVLGHAQALINPLLYGIWWRKTLLKKSTGQAVIENGKDSAPEQPAP